MPFKDLEQKHNLVNRVILACGKRPTDADINPLLEERLERFYEDAVIEGMAKQMHSSVDRAVNTMAKPEQEPQMIQIKDGQLSYIKKPWVNLTDDEVYEIANFCKDQSFSFYAKEIENKLKDKNT
jgi:hypothetical protein